MSIDISATTSTAVTSKGEKTVYSFDVVDPKTGQIKESYNTTDPKKAEAYYKKSKQKYPAATTNGENTDPFSDGTFDKQGEDYEVGGWKGAKLAEEHKDTADKQVVNTSGTDNLYNEEDIRQFNTPGSGKAVPAPVSSLKKPAIDVSGLSPENKKKYEEDKKKNQLRGVFNGERIQARCKRENAPSEKVIGQGSDNNAFIVIGNDRPGKQHTGYGGKGHTQCDAIDIVCGMGGASPKERDKDGNENKHNPNFFVDSARIYISQKTDVDKNFGIGEFGMTQADDRDDKDDDNAGPTGAKSAVAVKADNVRLIARETIRLVTGTDAKNSQAGDASSKTGIELVAMNKVDTLQPMVLGDNLQLALVTILNNLEALAKIFHGYVKYQMKYNQALQQHTHNKRTHTRL